MTMTWFVDDDAAYEAWLAAHAEGYVANTWARSQGGASVLHRATCRRISGKPPAGRVWTHFYGKACAEDRAEVVAWVKARTGKDPVTCATCLPPMGPGGRGAAGAAPRMPDHSSSPEGHAPRIVSIARMARGPALVIEDAARLARDFFTLDASSLPGGYDDLAGRGEPDRITSADIVAINTTMRARSPHRAWADLTDHRGLLPWLSALDSEWDLIAPDEATWSRAQPANATALTATVARGRGLSVATKVLHLKRPGLFPVLDSLVLQQLGVTDSIAPMAIVEHLRAEGRRNLEVLQAIQAALRPTYERSLVRILDALLWSSHPAAGIAPALGGWEHVVRPVTLNRTSG
jgi:hypothetical protein